MGNDVGVDPRNRFSSVPIFSLPQRRENGCREAVWGPESPPSGAIDPHAPPASVASTSVSLDSGTRVPDPVSCRRSARAKKKTENVHSESAKQSRLRVAHGRALRGSRRLSVPQLKFGRTPSLSAGRRRRDRATSNFRFSTVLATLARGFRSTMRDRPRLLRSKVRQLHQVSLRGMGRPTRGILGATVRRFPDQPRNRIFGLFRYFYSPLAVEKNTLKKHGNTHLQYNYVL
jgi:hypothetical protein